MGLYKAYLEHSLWVLSLKVLLLAAIPTGLLWGSLLPSLNSLPTAKTEGNSEVIWRGLMHLGPNVLAQKNLKYKKFTTNKYLMRK